MSIAELRKYEAIVIANPDLNEEAFSKLQTQLGELVTRHGGQVLETIPLGKRKLSYKIGKALEGNYLQVRLQAPASEIVQLKKALGLMESIIRFMVIQGTIPLRDVRHMAEGSDPQKGQTTVLEIEE